MASPTLQTINDMAKTLVTLSASALVFSVSAVQIVQGTAEYKELLAVAWILFAGTVVLAVFLISYQRVGSTTTTS